MKVLLIVLVLVVVVFIVLTVWGASANGNSTTDWRSFHADSFPALESLGNLFGSAGPKLTAIELTPDPQSGAGATPGSSASSSTFVLRAGDQPTKFFVTPDSKDKFRKATFLLSREGCAKIEYATLDGSGGKLKNQNWPDDGSDPKYPTTARLQILPPKGHLTFRFQLPGCTVQLK